MGEWCDVRSLEWRGARCATSWARLLFFFGCVALGVASIVVLRSVMQQVRVTLTREARTLVGADLVIQSTRPWTPELRARLDAVLDEGGAAPGRAEIIDTQTMASAGEERGTGVVRLVELRGLSDGFPFYGTLELQSGTFSHALVRNQGVLVQPELLIELGLEAGDVLRLGGRSFEIRGVVTRDRVQRGGGFALGPRVYVDIADLRATSLLGFGSRATYQIVARVDDQQLEPLARDLRADLRREVATVRSWRSLEDRLGRNLTVSENYLSLVGFAIVVLGGIGVWSVTRVIVQQKLRSVAILKCLGASSRRVLAVYVLQVLALAAGGALIGVVVGAVALSRDPSVAARADRRDLDGLDHLVGGGQGVAVGLLVSLLFALGAAAGSAARQAAAAPARRHGVHRTQARLAELARVASALVWRSCWSRCGRPIRCAPERTCPVGLAGGRVVVGAVEPVARAAGRAAGAVLAGLHSGMRSSASAGPATRRASS